MPKLFCALTYEGGLPISPPPGAISNIVPPSNALYGLREFYESGEMADDEENGVELMIQLNGMVYHNMENNG